MAAAFAALVSLYNNIPLIWNHPRHSFSFEDEQLLSLGEKVYFLIGFMTSFDNSYGAAKEASEALGCRIACAVQAAEDVIESHVVDQIHSGSTLGGNRRYRFLLDLQKAIQDLDFVWRKALNVQKSLSGLKLEQPIASAAATASATPPASEKNIMVGFDDQFLPLLDQLTGAPSSSRRVIPIEGMGGIGKTTLAINAYQHPYIVHYFDVRLWATISQEFSVYEILNELLASLSSQVKEETCFLSETSSGESSVADLGLVLHKSLYGRRYLIILDDIWSVQAWDQIQVYFPDTSNGSHIVVTTRHSHVARCLGFASGGIHVRLLDKDSSWDLFCKKTFENHSCPSQFEYIGKKIVDKCRGLPLAIIVIGGHLRKSPMVTEYWESIANDMSSVLNSKENEQCFNVLSLSYRHLPVKLKPCFLFLGVFPEDKEIPVLELLNLWIAEGFIVKYENQSLEDVAWRYLIDLYGRNLVSIYEKWESYINMTVCRIHDLIRELCFKIAKKEEFFSVIDTQHAITVKRRVVIKGKIPEANHQAKLFVDPRSKPHIRSLTCQGGQLSFNPKLLRILNKVDSNKINSQLVNLRYLKADLYTCHLPGSISLLWNLQTLIINGIFGPIIAPYEIWEMLQLRHVEVDPIHLPLPLLTKKNVLVLKNLHTLSQVQNLRLSEEVCRRIPNIKNLEVSYRDEPSSDYCFNNFSRFQKLESLLCSFDSNAKWHDFALNLTFPNSLKWLQLHGCRLSWKEVTMKVGFLPHLEILYLYGDAISGSEWTPVEGEVFPRLRKMHICHRDLIHWNVNEFCFPVLEHLALEAPKLNEFPSGIGEIPTLRTISLLGCSMSSNISALRMIAEQIEQGNEDLHLQFTIFDDEEALEMFKQKVQGESSTSNNIHLRFIKRKKMISC